MLTRIASVYFAPVRADRSIYGGMYTMPAVVLNGEPVVLEVNDRVQHDEGPFELGQGGRRAKLRYPVWGEEIAADILAEWTERGLGMTPDCHPGMWIARDRIALTKTDANGNQVMALDIFDKQTFRDATPAEKRAMWEEDMAFARVADRRYAEWCFLQGNGIAGEPRLIPFIPKNYKLGAQQYGFTAVWTKEGGEQVAPCPHCQTVIPRASTVCPKCIQVIDVAAYAKFEATKELAMMQARRDLGLEARPGGMGLSKKPDVHQPAV